MKFRNIYQDILTAFFIILLVSPTSHAEIYKWTDAEGKIHYSDKKDDAGRKAVEVKVQSKSPDTPTVATQNWQERERQFQERQASKPVDRSSIASRPKPLSDGKSDNTDTSRCNLARDVLSGAVRHSNGSSTDKNDRDIAQNDVKNFCR